MEIFAVCPCFAEAWLVWEWAQRVDVGEEVVDQEIERFDRTDRFGGEILVGGGKGQCRQSRCCVCR